MKLSLREAQEARVLRNTIATLKSEIEHLLWMLGNTTSNTSVTNIGVGGDASDSSVDFVEALPPIPDEGYRKVIWVSAGAGTGDDQAWETHAGKARWYPCYGPTTYNGAPGS